MLVYLGIDLTVLLLGIMLSRSKVSMGRRIIDGNKCFFILIASVLLFFSAFRGDFSADYNGYAREIWLRFSNYSIKDIINRGYNSNPEPGYLLFQYFVKQLTNNSLFIFVFSSLLIVASNLKEIKRSGVLPYLGVFLFVEVGNYYESFNLMRQVMSASIVILGSKYLFERKFWKYIIIVLIASTFHISALIMIPFYFVCGIKLGKKSLIIYPIVMFLLLFAQDRLMAFTGQYIWSWYDVSLGGYSWKNIIAGGLVAILGLSLYYTNTKSDIITSNDNSSGGVIDFQLEDNIYLSSTYFCLLFLLMGLYFSYSKRFSSYFSLYSICFCCRQIERSHLKNALILALIVFYIVFGFVTKLSLPYYFIWNN